MEKIKFWFQKIAQMVRRPFTRILRILNKLARDFLSVFYDDLNFEAMSLPRLILGMGAGMMFVTWLHVLRGHEFRYFPELTAFCSASMAPYSVKKVLPALMSRFGGQKDDKGDGDGV